MWRCWVLTAAVYILLSESFPPGLRSLFFDRYTSCLSSSRILALRAENIATVEGIHSQRAKAIDAASIIDHHCHISTNTVISGVSSGRSYARIRTDQRAILQLPSPPPSNVKMEDAHKISITICGDGGCGKSSITLRLVRSQWTHEYVEASW